LCRVLDGVSEILYIRSLTYRTGRMVEGPRDWDVSITGEKPRSLDWSGRKEFEQFTEHGANSSVMEDGEE
jgi:hypothetical protein